MSDVYKIGITVALTNLIGSELTRIARDFGAADKSASAFGIRLGVVAVAMAGVTAALTAGISEARKFQTEVAKFSLYGMSDKLNRDAQSFAENIRIAGVSQTESMHLMNEAQGVFRQSGRTGEDALAAAKTALPMLEKIAFIQKSLYGKGDASATSADSLAMLRWIDMTGGAQSPERFNQLADLGFRLTTTSGGQIDWEQLRQFRARAKSAGFSVSDDMYAMAEPIIGELKGMTAGNSLSTAYNRAHGITKPTNQAVAEWMKLGLWDSSKVKLNSLGGVQKFLGDPLVDAAGYDANFIKWYLEHVKPAYDKHGLSPDERIRENALLFNATGGNLMSLVDRQASVIGASYQAVGSAKHVDAAYDVARQTMDGRLVDLTAQWSTLMKQLGDEILPGVNAALGYFVDGLKMINDNWSHVVGLGKSIGSAALESTPFGAALGIGTMFSGSSNSAAVPSASAGKPLVIQNNLHLPNGAVYDLGKQSLEMQIDGMAKAPPAGNSQDTRMTPYYPGYAY